ncbi:hypothetical protein EB796_023863 [Bugula neritina]|uniref:Uncharacterized protein n=1 Tax=Bugula neritina TaxID=10212 RepID=A0A7J7IV89_BUGNE|nr:hypothetical protein EB796_023863 [Bugula neritina]
MLNIDCLISKLYCLILAIKLHCIGSRVVAIIQLYVWVNDWGCVDTLYCSLSHGLGTKLLHNHFASLLNSSTKK